MKRVTSGNIRKTVKDEVVVIREEEVSVSCIFEILKGSFSSGEMCIGRTGEEFREQCNGVCEVKSYTNNSVQQ